MCCGGSRGRRSSAGGSGRTSRRSKGTRSTGHSRGTRPNRARSGRAAQESIRLGPLAKMKNTGEEPVVFDDVKTKASRNVKPGDWVYVFEAQTGDLLSAGMEKMDS